MCTHINHAVDRASAGEEDQSGVGVCKRGNGSAGEYMTECKPNCDYSKAVLKGRATWCCAKCGRDFSLEYLLWYMAAEDEE